jgi:amino acid transporter
MSVNDYEKNQYAVQGDTTPPHDHGIKNIVETKGAAQGEAADIYGDVATAEQYGYVERNLKSRHIQFIAIGGKYIMYTL